MQSRGENFEIIDMENDFTSEQERQFSHQKLVMKVMDKCLEAGCKEMRRGYFNTKYDPKTGTTTRNYIEDTRLIFIESIETAEMVMECDVDKEAKEAIKKLKESLEKRHEDLCKLEKEDWDNCSASTKRLRWSKMIYHTENGLNDKLPYYQDYIKEQVEIGREIFKELTKLTERLGFYQEEGLIA